MSSKSLNTDAVVGALNKILELELAGVVRYTHHSLMVVGYSRIPIVSWLQTQATESLTHATEAGEMVGNLGAEPSLGVGQLLQTHSHDVGEILRQSLEHETAALKAYEELLELVEGKSVLIEEYARRLISEESLHQAEVAKMLRQPA